MFCCGYSPPLFFDHLNRHCERSEAIQIKIKLFSLLSGSPRLRLAMTELSLPARGAGERSETEGLFNHSVIASVSEAIQENINSFLASYLDRHGFASRWLRFCSLLEKEWYIAPKNLIMIFPCFWRLKCYLWGAFSS